MDKNAIKKYAVWARNELIARVSQRAQRYGITKDQIVDANADSVNGIILTDTEKKQRQALIQKIRKKGFEQVMEEVAYTWFNRFSALRFMEVNGYLPSHVRVFTDQNNAFKPEIMAEAIHLDLDGLDMEKVYALKEANNDDELFKYLIITQCNDLSRILPGMFQKIADYTELLFLDYLLRDGSVVETMVKIIPEDDWKNQVQIIGWLYQYYIAEPKDTLINARKQYKKDDIPFVTQLFTSDWIVRYMVENSLGLMWKMGHPTSNICEKWDYFFSYKKEYDFDGPKVYSNISPESIKCIDPCSGSGHILCYMFDVLIQLYEDYGYSARESVEKIVKQNLWGLDIDERASQLAYFSVMMKARQYDRRFFSRNIQPNVYTIPESNDIDESVISFFIGQNTEIKRNIEILLSAFKDAKIYGSLICIPKVDYSLLFNRIDEIHDEVNLFSNTVEKELLPLINVAYALSQKYDAVITNPPYMNASYMPPALKEFVQRYYADFKSDLFSCFTYKALVMCKEHGHVGLLMPYVWMFISSYEGMRRPAMKSQV